MKLGLINSAWVQSGRGTSFGIHKTKEIGFDAIDIFADPLDIDDAEQRLIKDECDAAGLPIISVACVAVGLVDFNPSVQRFHMERVRAYLDMAHRFEAKNVLLVLGEYIWQKEVIPPAEQWAAAVKNVRGLGDHAGGLGLEIALELEPFQLSLLNDVASMVRFLDDVDHPAVKANLDISHLVLSRQPASLIERLRGRVAHVHISDCDGKVHGDLPPGAGWSSSHLTWRRSRAWTSPRRRSRSSWSIRRSRQDRGMGRRGLREDSRPDASGGTAP